MFKRTMYLIYYLKELDRKKFFKFLNYVHETKGIGKLYLYSDIIFASYKYNIGLLDYFIFRFFDKNSTERSEWVGTGFKYEYDLKMNPKRYRSIIENKIEFYDTYHSFILHSYCTIGDLKSMNQRAKKVLNSSEKLVIKDALGQCGYDVEVISKDSYSTPDLLNYMENRGFNLIEEFVVQHRDLDNLSPSGLNTVRVITQINSKGGVDFLGARMRISVNNFVDNLASGNLAAPISLETGKINGPAIYSDITKEAVTVHPITKVKILGFQIPFWKEVLDLTQSAALFRPENKAIGWDVAITSIGPEFIEGNHNWCKILWQLPINSGQKHVLNKYLEDYNY